MIENAPYKRQSIDWWLVGAYLLLVLIGWVNIYAATHTAEAGSLLDFGGRAGIYIPFILSPIVSTVGDFLFFYKKIIMFLCKYTNITQCVIIF